MGLTREFRMTILERAQSDQAYRQAMLAESVSELIVGNLQIAKPILRDYINATISFEVLAKKVGKNSKSLQRMFSSAGNPTMKSLNAVLRVLQEKEGIHLQVVTYNSKA